MKMAKPHYAGHDQNVVIQKHGKYSINSMTKTCLSNAFLGFVFLCVFLLIPDLIEPVCVPCV